MSDSDWRHSNQLFCIIIDVQRRRKRHCIFESIITKLFYYNADR